MTLDNTKAKLQGRGKPRGPKPWLKKAAELSGYNATYLSRAINGHVKGPVLIAVEELRAKKLIPKAAGK